MSKKFQLSIPTPCHENWDDMTPVEKGRFCGSCQKQVVDFSRMSDREIAMFFKKPSTGSICGRFMEDQLDRDIEIPKKRIPWIKYFFQFALPAFLISAKATAQGKNKIKKQSNIEVCTPTLGLISPVIVKKGIENAMILPSNKDLIIKGKVIDENNDPIPFARITIKGTNNGALTDGHGFFSITLEEKWEEIKIVATASSFKPSELSIDADHYSKNQDFVILMKQDSNSETAITTGCIFPKKKTFNDTLVLPEVFLVSYQETFMGKIAISGIIKSVQNKDSSSENTQTCTFKVGGAVTGLQIGKRDTIFQSIKKIISDTVSRNFKIYPNPAKPGATLNIEWKQSETGEYILQIFNQAGQLTFNKEMWIDDEARVLNLEVPHVAAGNYFLQMTNKNSGKAFTEKILIQ